MTKKYRALFIGKGGSKAGMGHLFRLGTLMSAFKRDYDVSIVANLDETGRYFFDQQGIRFSLYRDARDLRAFLKRYGFCDIIVMDMYPFPKNHLRVLDDHCDVLLCFDDMLTHKDEKIRGVWICPQETFNCEINSEGETAVVKGSDYFPLRPELLVARSNKVWSPQVKNLAIVLGGAPQETHIYELTRLLDSFLDSRVKLHVVGGFTPVREKLVSISPRIYPMQHVDNMGDFISQMDLGIIAGGFIKFDFMCIGTPFAMISLCSHQDRLGRKFSSQGYGDYWGRLTDCFKNPQVFKKKVLALFSDENRRSEISVRSQRLVDGHGTRRILKLAEDMKKGKKVA